MIGAPLAAENYCEKEEKDEEKKKKLQKKLKKKKKKLNANFKEYFSQTLSHLQKMIIMKTFNTIHFYYVIIIMILKSIVCRKFIMEEIFIHY